MLAFIFLSNRRFIDHVFICFPRSVTSWFGSCEFIKCQVSLLGSKESTPISIDNQTCQSSNLHLHKLKGT